MEVFVIKKLSCFLFVMLFSAFLSAEIEYEIQDIGTLQTHSSQAIAINNNSQILGWYNIDGTAQGKHFFVRDCDGTFHELPEKIPGTGMMINWQYLTDEGKAYGLFDVNAATIALCMWDNHNGVVKLGVLPGKEVVAINNAGQVLIKSVAETENGKTIRRPIIWFNGQITKLKGLEGNVGIESEESYGLDMNNHGDVVGQSVAYLSYKNNIYKQARAVKWVKGKASDLHTSVAKAESTIATGINDLGDVIIGGQLLRTDGKVINGFYVGSKKTETNFFLVKHFADCGFVNRDGKFTNLCDIKTFSDHDCIWMNAKGVGMNDKGEVIAHGKTVWGENHALLLTPINPN